jgi:hypothetical protein
MENINKSPELEAFRRMNERKANEISEQNILEFVTSIPSDGITVSGLDWEIGKKAISLSIEIDRGSATESLTWELKAKKK